MHLAPASCALGDRHDSNSASPLQVLMEVQNLAEAFKCLQHLHATAFPEAAAQLQGADRSLLDAWPDAAGALILYFAACSPALPAFDTTAALRHLPRALLSSPIVQQALLGLRYACGKSAHRFLQLVPSIQSPLSKCAALVGVRRMRQEALASCASAYLKAPQAFVLSGLALPAGEHAQLHALLEHLRDQGSRSAKAALADTPAAYWNPTELKFR